MRKDPLPACLTPKELIPLLGALQNSGKNLHRETQMQRFFAAPPLIESAQRSWPPFPGEKLRRLPLESRVYLDYEEKAVSARLEFVYGDSAINPFTAADPEEQRAR